MRQLDDRQHAPRGRDELAPRERQEGACGRVCRRREHSVRERGQGYVELYGQELGRVDWCALVGCWALVG